MCGAFSFPRSHRLRARSDFSRVFDARVKAARGPLVLFAAPSSLPYSRLGIVIGRAAGGAVRRNRIKRHLREAFRTHHRSLDGRYDFVAVVRPHDADAPIAWGTTLIELMRALDARRHRPA